MACSQQINASESPHRVGGGRGHENVDAYCAQLAYTRKIERVKDSERKKSRERERERKQR